VYLEVHGIIRGTRQFVDDISARYFQGFHPHLPIISRTRFYDNLITLGAAPAADFSILLLTICLITHAPALGYRPGDGATPSIEQQSLYLTARSLFAQVQVSCSSSVPLIQASLLLAVYEYTNGRPDDAFVTIAGSARMAYAARIHTGDRHQTHLAHTIGHNEDRGLLLQAEEAANTWWGIIICERYVSPRILGKSSTQKKLRRCWWQDFPLRSGSLPPTACHYLSWRRCSTANRTSSPGPTRYFRPTVFTQHPLILSDIAKSRRIWPHSPSGLSSRSNSQRF
jgi:hypothetical protein